MARLGWTDPWIVGLIAVAAAALIGMLIAEPRRSEPLIDLRFFRSPPFSGAITISVVMSASLGGFLFLNTLYLQDLRHFSPLRAQLMQNSVAPGARTRSRGDDTLWRCRVAQYCRGHA